MTIDKITDNGLILAIIVRQKDWQEGINFFSSEKDYLQVGTWHYEKRKKIAPHIHLTLPREALKTQEFIFVKNGRLRADIYSVKEKLIKSVELEEGDLAIFLEGGHGFEILEDNTKVLEAKNGPYLGVEQDKKKFYEKRD